MIISRLILENWKNFQKIDVSLADRMFIVGANASGKSNLLDSIRFLRDISKRGLQYAVVEQRGGFSRIRCLAARQFPNITIEVHLSEKEGEEPIWKYKLMLKPAEEKNLKNEARIVQEFVWDKTGKRILNRNNSNSNKEDEETLKFTDLEQIRSNKSFREIYHFFQETQYLHIVPQLLREADSYVFSSNKEDFYGRNLLVKISETTKQIRERYFKKINDVLRIAVPQLEELKFVKDDNTGLPHLEARYIHWRKLGAKQQEVQFSDGTLRLIGFMWALLDGKETILMEEPELYLHTEIVKQIADFISKLQRKKGKENRQVIMTTHSYDLLDNQSIGANEVLILENSQEGTIVKVVKDSADLVNYLDSGFSMAETVIPKVAPKNISAIQQVKIWD